VIKAFSASLFQSTILQKTV